MSNTPPTTLPRQTSSRAGYTPSPSTSPPSDLLSPNLTSVDVTYQVVRIKPTSKDWLTPSPSDIIQIIGPVSRVNTPISDDEEAAEDDGFGVPCAAHLSWGNKSIHLTCLYYPSASLFMDFGGCIDETANAADEAERVRSVSVTMQDVIFGKEETGGEVVEDEDVRDDDGNPFMVLHVNEGLGASGSARLYCKKVPDRQNGLTDGIVESLGLEKSEDRMDAEIDVVGQEFVGYMDAPRL